MLVIVIFVFSLLRFRFEADVTVRGQVPHLAVKFEFMGILKRENSQAVLVIVRSLSAT